MFAPSPPPPIKIPTSAPGKDRKIIILLSILRVGQVLGVYGIQGSYNSGIRYIYAEIWVLSISFVFMAYN